MKSLLLVFLLIFSACGTDAEDLVDLAVESANSQLTVGNCQAAIDGLEDVGRQNKHAPYLKTLASAYACRAGYSTQTLFDTDASKIGTPSILGGFASFSTSIENDDPQNQSYLDMQEAINILLYAGGIDTDLDPTMSRRRLIFDSNNAGDINAMIMYLTMAQMGKYFYFYGNSDSAGEKGAGTGGNGCIANYENFTMNAGAGASLDTILVALPVTNSCQGTTAATTGSNYLGTEGSLNASRMCEGLVLFNNFFHVFPTVISDIGGDSLGSIGTFQTAIQTLKDAMVAAHPQAIELQNVRSQTKCELLSAADTDHQNLQVFFVFLIESLFD